MYRSGLGILTVAVGLFATADSVRAHHSFAAEFAADKPMTVKGVLTEVKWENPHMWVYVDEKDAAGHVTHWGFEAGPPATVIRMGVNKGNLVPGTEVTIHGYHAKDLAQNFGQARDVTLPDGRRIIIGAKADDNDK